MMACTWQNLEFSHSAVTIAAESGVAMHCCLYQADTNNPLTTNQSNLFGFCAPNAPSKPDPLVGLPFTTTVPQASATVESRHLITEA